MTIIVIYFYSLTTFQGFFVYSYNVCKAYNCTFKWFNYVICSLMTEHPVMMYFLNYIYNMVYVIQVCNYLIIYFKPVVSNHIAPRTIKIYFPNKTVPSVNLNILKQMVISNHWMVPSVYDIWYLRRSMPTLSPECQRIQ